MSTGLGRRVDPFRSNGGEAAMTARLVGIFGTAGYVCLMAAGYAYNLTFVQLGLTSLARDRIRLSDAEAALAMGGLAIGTCLVALGVGRAMAGWRARGKLRIAAAAITLQTVLTATVASVTTAETLAIWLVLGSVALGCAMPATFGLATDLVPVRWRGLTAAAITGLAYGGAIVFLADWDALELADRLLAPMALGAVGLGLLALAPGPFRTVIAAVEDQARDVRFARGRFAGPEAGRRLIVAAGLLFGVFFIDSLGFVRLVDTAYIAAAWQSPEALDRQLLVLAHVAGALAAGVLYAAFDERLLLPWIFGIFALVALMYVADTRFPLGGPSQALAMPILYAVGVSLYTVLTFALWPDLSTPANVTRNVALGVALSAWTATFFSTALALAWRTSGVNLDRHLSAVAAVALLALTGLLLRAALRPGVAR